MICVESIFVLDIFSYKYSTIIIGYFFPIKMLQYMPLLDIQSMSVKVSSGAYTIY